MQTRSNLREEFKSSLSIDRRQGLRTVSVQGGVLLGAMVAVYLASRLLTAQVYTVSNPALQGLSDLQAKLLNELLFSILASVIAPIATLALLLNLAVLTAERISRYKLLNTPALASQFLVFNRSKQLLHSRQMRAFAIFCAFLIALGLVLGLINLHVKSTGPLAMFLLWIVVVGACAITVWRYLNVSVFSRGRFLLSPTFARRKCGADLITIAIATVACTLVLGSLVFAGRQWTERASVRISDAESALDQLVERLPSSGSSAAEYQLISRASEVSRENIELVRTGISAASDLISDELGKPIIGAMFFMFCFVAYLDIGLTMLMVEFRKPWLPLLILPIASLLLERAWSATSALVQGAGPWEVLVRFGALAAAFVTGQACGLFLRNIIEPSRMCERCGYPVDERDTICKECNTRVQRLRMGTLVGNRQTRELHVDDCAHARRIGELNKEYLKSATEAYWRGFDNCGTCLGGSGYSWRSSGSDSS